MTQEIVIQTPQVLADPPIGELVARWPDTMRILAPLGIDLCCGGARLLGEALDLHGIVRDPVLAAVAAEIAGGR